MIHSSTPPVHFHFIQPISLTNRSLLKQVIASIFKKEQVRLGELNYIFCSDDYLLEINRTHLKHDYYTDIITFDLSDEPGRIKGEIYISIDRVRDNAQTFKVSIQQELRRVIFHGALHLCGYKDKTTKDIQLMRNAENHYLSQYLSKVRQ